MKKQMFLLARMPDGSIWESRIPNLLLQNEADSNKPEEGCEDNSLPKTVEEILNATDISSRGEQEHYIEAFTTGAEFTRFRWKQIKPPTRRKTIDMYSVIWAGGWENIELQPKLKIVVR